MPSLPEERGLREGYRTDRELASSWVVGQGERGRRESHESGGRDTSGVSDWSAEVEEDFERRSQVSNVLVDSLAALFSSCHILSFSTFPTFICWTVLCCWLVLKLVVIFTRCCCSRQFVCPLF